MKIWVCRCIFNTLEFILYEFQKYGRVLELKGKNMNVSIEDGTITNLNSTEMGIALQALETYAVKLAKRPVARLSKEVREVRNTKIVNMRGAGASLVAIGEAVGLTAGRVSQILCAAKQAAIPVEPEAS